MLPVLFACAFAVANAGYLTGGDTHNLLYSGHVQEQHIPVIVDGVPVETPEVQRAKAEHFQAFARAKAVAAQQEHTTTKVIYKSAPISTQTQLGWENAYQSPIVQQQSYGSHGWRVRRSLLGYEAEQHVPVITENGVPEETPEVLHAKAQHFEAVNNARLSHNGWSQNNLLNAQNGWKQDQTVAWIVPQQNNAWTQVQQTGWTPKSSGWTVKSTEWTPKSTGWTQKSTGWTPKSSGWTPKLSGLQNGWAAKSAVSYTINHGQQYLNSAKWQPTNIGWTESVYQDVPKITHEGVPEETPEVQLAKAQHLAIHAQESAKHAGWVADNDQWKNAQQTW